MACASTDENADRWQVFAFAEGGVMSRLLGKDERAQSLASLFSAVRRCLESGPTPSCLTSALAYLLAIPIVWLFREWLQQGLDAIRAELLA